MVWTWEISSDNGNESIIKSYMEGNKRWNILWYSYWHTNPHADPQIEKKYIYNNSHINCGSDKKYKQFYNNQFCSCTLTPIGITLNQL